jgi:hypothetical protein
MKKKTLVFFTSMLLIVALAFPAAASNVQLQVNGEKFATDIYVDSQFSMIALNDFVYLTGADVEWITEDEFAIKGNNQKVLMSVGIGEASLGDSALALPVVPVKTDKGTYVPLRATGNALGFAVDWDNAQRMVVLARDEVRDGITAVEMLAKSTAAQNEVNTYTLDGVADIAISVADASGEPIDAGIPTDFVMSMKISGQLQNAPFQAYLKTKVDTDLVEVSLDSDTFITGDRIYTNTVETGWFYMETPMMQDLWRQQLALADDPIKLTGYLQDTHRLLVYGNDRSVGGKDYFVVNAIMDGEAVLEQSQDLLSQFVDVGMFPSGSDEEMAEAVELAEAMFKNMQLECKYTMLINKETYVSDFMEIDMTMELPINTAEFAPELGDEAETVIISMKMTGAFGIYGLNVPFKAPDVSGALSMAEMMSALMGEADAGEEENGEDGEDDADTEKDKKE